MKKKHSNYLHPIQCHKNSHSSMLDAMFMGTGKKQVLIKKLIPSFHDSIFNLGHIKRMNARQDWIPQNIFHVLGIFWTRQTETRKHTYTHIEHIKEITAKFEP